MSQAPHFIRAMRAGIKFGSGAIEDSILNDGLTDAYDKLAMGFFAEKTAKEFGISREDQDRFCLESYELAMEAQ